MIAKPVAAALAVAFLVMCGGCAAPDRGSDATTASQSAPVQDSGAPREVPPPATPDAALARLRAGNARFAAGAITPRVPAVDYASRHPGMPAVAAVLSCSEGAVLPELLFDEAPDALLGARVPGGRIDGALLGGLELAVRDRGVRVIVVLGEPACPSGGPAAAAPVRRIVDASPYLRAQIREGRLAIAAARLEPATGIVRFIP